ncbi:hypothetical protein BLNAU_1391 [Blattamonas nauphoetae]|uniref:Uncharacterized protein n=1 Tax=Blattamonas nauphoetae TaxID=2049346 RepID=A0ABQ9YJA5_9EUKA|nr:hypothetical protein BLNAU_1391 [Blattamonas nauphoetae]
MSITLEEDHRFSTMIPVFWSIINRIDKLDGLTDTEADRVANILHYLQKYSDENLLYDLCPEVGRNSSTFFRCIQILLSLNFDQINVALVGLLAKLCRGRPRILFDVLQSNIFNEIMSLTEPDSHSLKHLTFHQDLLCTFDSLVSFCFKPNPEDIPVDQDQVSQWVHERTFDSLLQPSSSYLTFIAKSSNKFPNEVQQGFLSTLFVKLLFVTGLSPEHAHIVENSAVPPALLGILSRIQDPDVLAKNLHTLAVTFKEMRVIGREALPAGGYTASIMVHEGWEDYLEQWRFVIWRGSGRRNAMMMDILWLLSRVGGGVKGEVHFLFKTSGVNPGIC